MTERPAAFHDPRVCVFWARPLSVFSPLCTNLIREICSYLVPTLYLVSVRKDNISFFDFRTMKLGPSVPLERLIQVLNSSWAVIDDGRLVVCGGRDGELQVGPEPWKTAYEVHRSGRVESLRDMIHSRDSSGVIVWKGSVHVFGSYTGEASPKCERLSLIPHVSQWEELVNMAEPRSLFSPAVWRNAIYLCGGNNNDRIEVFDGVTIHRLDLKLPGYKSCTVACVREDCLLMLSCQYLSEMSGLCTAPRLVSKRHEFCSVYPETGALLYGEVIVTVGERQISKYRVSDGYQLE